MNCMGYKYETLTPVKKNLTCVLLILNVIVSVHNDVSPLSLRPGWMLQWNPHVQPTRRLQEHHGLLPLPLQRGVHGRWLHLHRYAPVGNSYVKGSQKARCSMSLRQAILCFLKAESFIDNLDQKIVIWNDIPVEWKFEAESIRELSETKYIFTKMHWYVSLDSWYMCHCM